VPGNKRSARRAQGCDEFKLGGSLSCRFQDAKALDRTYDDRFKVALLCHRYDDLVTKTIISKKDYT
jgi:hypothetical protein